MPLQYFPYLTIVFFGYCVEEGKIKKFGPEWGEVVHVYDSFAN
jgi:hypothetical protein